MQEPGLVYVNMPSLLEQRDTYQFDAERKFKCEECGRGYRHAGSLANHRKTHDVGSFQCHICSRKLSNALSLKSHLRIHLSRKKYSCADCGKAFRLATQLATHQKIHRNKSSPLNVSGSSRIGGDFKEDLLALDGVDFDIMPDLHPDMKLNLAPISNGSASSHVLDSTPESEGDGDKPYKCSLCDKRYRHHGSLVNHKKTHEMGIYECSVCFRKFNNRATLSTHQRSHGKTRASAGPQTCDDDRDAKPQPARHSLPRNGVLFCHLCQIAFVNNDEFESHILLHNSASVSFETDDNVSEEKYFQYDDSVTHTPKSNASTDSSPLDPLLDKSVSFDQSEAVAEHSSMYEASSFHDHSFTINAQGQSVAPDLRTNSIDLNIKLEDGEDSDRRFKCDICGKSYRHGGSLINHKRSHQTGIFKCSICHKSYPHLAALRSHIRIHKGRPSALLASSEGDWLSSEPLTHDQQGFSCHDGDMSGLLDFPQGLVDAVMPKLDGNPKAADFPEQFGDSFPMHLPHGEPVMERHMCADCGRTFGDIAGIKSHVCPHLNQQYQSMMNGSAHMDFADAKPRFLDEEVDFEGHQQNFQQNFHDINDSIGNGEAKSECEDSDEEDDGEMYQCSICGSHYTSLHELRSHLENHTQSGVSAGHDSSAFSAFEVKPDEPCETPQGECGLIICSTCGESFAKQQDLQAHQLLHNNPEGGPPEQTKREIQTMLKPKVEMESVICGKCGKSCSDLYHLETHICTGQRDRQEVEITNEKSLLRTARLEPLQAGPDVGEQLFRCDQCGRSYRHAGSLLNHKKSHKTGVFRCYVCQKRFYNLLALKNHQRSHFDVKKHSCTECGKAFKMHKQLLNHQRVHEENKAKIEELNKQIQTLLQMSGNASGSGVQARKSSRKKVGRRLHNEQIVQKQPEARNPSDPRPFVCNQCGKSYRHAGSLVNHKNSHKTGEYYCALCNNTYSNQLAMKNHLRLHFAVKRHRCQVCGRAFRGNKQLLNHICSLKRPSATVKAKVRGRKPKNDLRCKHCRLVFPDAELLTGHTCGNAHASASSLTGSGVLHEERPFKCDVCGRSYRHAGSLLNHKNTHKTGHFSCAYCAKPFSNPMALRNHTRIHTQKKKFVCPTCGKAFRLSSILYNHQKIHTRGVSHYSCQTCGKHFQGRSGLKRHRCFQNDKPGSSASQDGAVKCYACDQCGRSYRHAGSLLNHKKSHSADLLHCTLCLKTFANTLDLESHSRMARHCCPDCGKTFCEFSHLQSHMEVHNKALPYYCSPCQQNFPNAASFQQHQELHANSHDYHPKISSPFNQPFPGPQDDQDSLEDREEKSHVCEHCGRTYRHAGSLLNHKNSHKTGSFFCSVCQKEFSNLMALKNHRRIHTEPKRYQCLECGKAFRVSTQLICHRRIHTKEKPFSCLFCDKSFSSKSNLRHHQKMHQSSQQAYQPSYSMDSAAFMGLGVEQYF